MCRNKNVIIVLLDVLPGRPDGQDKWGGHTEATVTRVSLNDRTLVKEDRISGR